ncbi:relaxin receptor 1-like [Penaeus vannamei]|uniref:relaxin receptor 1-like n=1 Tax=Penaeus vannamei TaxID=6689 RepID=UPI00387F5186
MGVSSFENLLIRRELRVAVWLVATLTLIGNLTVLTGRLLTRDDNKLLSLFIRNLAVSDLLTGVYLVIVGVKDLQFRSVYHENAHSWMTSRGCAVTGVLAMTSAEVSVLVLAFMSVERLVCIGRPLRSPGLSLASARLILSALWVCGLALAILPRDDFLWAGTNQPIRGVHCEKNHRLCPVESRHQNKSQKFTMDPVMILNTCDFSIRPSKDEWVSISSNMWAKVHWIEAIGGQMPLKIAGFHE